MATLLLREDKLSAFKSKLQKGRQDIHDLLVTWDQMSQEQKDLCLEETRVRLDDLNKLYSQLVQRTTYRMSFLECIFLGVLYLLPILFNLWPVDELMEGGE
jgi:hypothetical protein